MIVDEKLKDASAAATKYAGLWHRERERIEHLKTKLKEAEAKLKKCKPFIEYLFREEPDNDELDELVQSLQGEQIENIDS